MKKFEVSRITFLTLFFTGVALMLMLMGNVTEIGNEAYAAIAEMDCRYCHEDPNIVDDPNIPSRHHYLVNLPVPDITDRPFPDGDANGNYDCYSCHSLEWNPDTQSFEIQIFRDCLFCHTPKEITKATLRDGRITIQGSGLAIVKDSNIVYVDKTDGSLGTCPTDVVSWSDSLIEADSWLYPDGTVCAETGDTAVVPCAAAEITISKGKGGKPPKPCKGKKCN